VLAFPSPASAFLPESLCRKGFNEKSILTAYSTSEQAAYRLLRLFFKSQSALIALLLLSKSNPLRWASIWFWAQSQKKIDFTHLLQKTAVFW